MKHSENEHFHVETLVVHKLKTGIDICLCLLLCGLSGHAPLFSCMLWQEQLRQGRDGSDLRYQALTITKLLLKWRESVK